MGFFDPNHANAFVGLGETLYRLECYEESGAAYRRAIQLDNRISKVYVERAKTLVEEAKLLEAKYGCFGYFGSDIEKAEVFTAYQQAIQFHPTNADVFIALANAFYEFGHYEESGVAYRQAIQLDLGNSAVYSE